MGLTNWLLNRGQDNPLIFRPEARQVIELRARYYNGINSEMAKYMARGYKPIGNPVQDRWQTWHVSMVLENNEQPAPPAEQQAKPTPKTTKQQSQPKQQSHTLLNKALKKVEKYLDK